MLTVPGRRERRVAPSPLDARERREEKSLLLTIRRSRTPSRPVRSSQKEPSVGRREGI
uniref:Uncharacterized protein n=1 Tax=Anguilla anguilla TaxID=7936 RepID=A0A0E9XGM7_ANGAN